MLLRRDHQVDAFALPLGHARAQSLRFLTVALESRDERDVGNQRQHEKGGDEFHGGSLYPC